MRTMRSFGSQCAIPSDKLNARCAMHFVWRLAILLMVGLAPSASFAREPLPRSVLYLDENDPGLPFAQGISAAFRAALNARSAERIAVYAENLDLVRSSGPRYEEILKTYLREKYRDRPIDVITTIGPAALTFMLRARPELWPDVPAIFASVDPETAAQVQIPVGVTGLVRRQTVRDSVSVARALMPNLKRIALVGDRLERQNFRRHFEQEIPLLAAEVEIIDLTGLPMVELRKRVATLPEDTVIYFTTLTFDGDRPAYISRDALVSIAEVANRPIVVDLEPNVGYGGVGGLVADPDRIGSEAARLVLRILNGESAADIPVLAGNFVRPVFDWGELRRWNVSEHRLPAGSDVLFRQPGLWEQYKWYILAAAALVVIEAAFIVALLANRRRLQASEDRISLAADAANLRCWVHDLVTDQTWATQTGRNMLGWWPSRPFAFEQFMERVHPDDRESVRRAVQRSREDRTDYEAEYRLVVPSVGTRWVAARGRCEFDRDGKPLRMRGVNVDITKRRQAEEALRASEQRMGLAADAADLYCWEWEIPSDQVWTTGTGRNALDWRPSRPLTFEQVMERVHPDDRESMRQALQRSVEGGGDYEVDYRLVTPGVDTRWLAARGRCEFDRDGKPLRMRGVTIDITKRRQAEEALIASEQRVSLAADAANLRCWVHDLVTDQMWATQTGRNVLGWWPSRPLTFEQFMERVHPDDRQSVRRAVQRSREDRSDYEAEYRLVVPSVGTRWVAARGRCEFDCDGKPLRMRGVTIDITKRRQAEEAARELSGRLINAQEEERSRLARELHDDVTQRLALLAIDAGRGERNLPSAAGGTAMRAMRESLIRLSEDVHALAYRLHPSILEDLGLIEALKTECERFGRVASIPVDLKAQEVPDPLPHAVALCLFRIAQESLRNVERHARARQARVSLRCLNGGVQLVIEDDGAGFDPAQQRDRPRAIEVARVQRPVARPRNFLSVN